MRRHPLYPGMLAIAVVMAVAFVEGQQRSGAVAIDADDIGGVVTSARGPEAGVWVIAETDDLPTGYRKIVVTDDQGRYLVPDLPKARYSVWVRGYRLVDSARVLGTPGQLLNLTAVVAPDARAAAQIYPASYWYSLIEVPPESAFPMEEEGIESQLAWIARMKNDIQLTQIGDKATRELPPSLRNYDSTLEAWEAWLKLEPPVNVARLKRDVAVKMYADWTDRIAAGEVPAAPPRPQGVERNVVISQWDWGNEKTFIHDLMTTDTRNPTLNANGLVYAEEQFSSDLMVVLDPVKHMTWRVPVPMRDGTMEANRRGAKQPLTWGDEDVWPAKMRLHNQMFDQRARVWMTGKFREAENQPDFCKEGSDHPSARWFPLETNRDLQLILYEPKTKKFSLIDTCYQTHHLQFAADENHTLWNSGLRGGAVGWLNTKLRDETHDDAKAQGWCPFILDTNGNGRPDRGWVEPDTVALGGINTSADAPTQKIDPTRDKRIMGGGYGIGVNPLDGSVWLGTSEAPGFILRVAPGPNPPSTCLTEIYKSPEGTSNPKGVFIDRATGVVWVGFSGSDHFASFDRRNCKVLNGPTATGDHCPEGWTLYPQPGPKFKGVADDIGTDWYYLNWVDQFDTLGLGKNVPMAPGTNSDSVVALLPESNEWVVIRVPYPLGFFARGLDGRIDDPDAGWKGKGLWSTFASVKPWNMEGGKGMVPKAVKFQVRPDPLAH